MSCDQNPAMLAAYLDGELSPEQETAVYAHIASCPTCAAEIAELAKLQRSLRTARGHFTPAADFRQRMQQQFAPATVKPIAKPRPQLYRLFPLVSALAVMLLLAAGVFEYGYLQSSRTAQTFSQVADLHVNALASTNPVDVVSTDRHTVKPWFQGKIPFSFNVPEFAGTDFALLGGKLIYLQQQPGAQLIVAMKQHKISVLIFQDSPTLSNALRLDSQTKNSNSFNIETWRSQSLRFFVIGDTDPAEIDKLAQSLKQANN
jgi:anti-sigma factor RsiW